MKRQEIEKLKKSRMKKTADEDDETDQIDVQNELVIGPKLIKPTYGVVLNNEKARLKFSDSELI